MSLKNVLFLTFQSSSVNVAKRVNGNVLVEQVLDQILDHCIPTAICQALHMVHVLDSVRKKQGTDPSKMNLEPMKLLAQYDALFPSTDRVPKNLTSVHKFVKMSLILRDEGIALNSGGFYKIGDLCSIPRDDFEAICEELAQGNPLLTIFHPGPIFFNLRYCQVYRAPLLTKVIKECENGESVDSHMIVLIGAFSKDGLRGFYFLNSHGEMFCARNITENPEAVPTPAVCGGLVRFMRSQSFGTQ